LLASGDQISTIDGLARQVVLEQLDTKGTKRQRHRRR
jgi:hypothetical protein